jgi:hypothetical protein
MSRVWAIRLWYLLGALAILGAEVYAIVNAETGDTITENIRLVVFYHPLVWAVTLGATLGLLYWMTKHFWWRQK